jgi:hypothetical protein
MTDDSEQTRRQAKRDLDRLGSEGGVFGSPVMKSRVDSVRKHFAAEDADKSDPIEVAATRTGRLLAIAAFVGLAVWLLSFMTPP